MSGYIKDHRKELDSDIWQMPPLYHRVWQYLKYKVNHEEAEIPLNDGTHFQIIAGQHLTSIRNIAKGIGWYEGRVWKEPNPKTIKTILDWLVKVRMIEIDSGRGNRQYTLVTLINWEVYQTKEDRGNSKVTVKKQSADINKNEKNDKEKIPYAVNVFLTEKEYAKLCDEYGKESTDRFIEYLSLYKLEKNYKTKSDNLTIRRWVVDAVNKSQKVVSFGRTAIQTPEVQITDGERERLALATKGQIERNKSPFAINH